MASIGHNTIAGDKLGNIVERIERLEEQKADIAGDIRDIYKEAKDAGYDAKALRAVIKIRADDADKRAALQETIDIYMNALGELADTPLGKAAIRKVVAV